MPLEIELTLPERHPKFGIFSHNDLEKLIWCWCNQCCTYKKSEKLLEWTLSMTEKCFWGVILIKKQCWELTVYTSELQSKFIDVHGTNIYQFLCLKFSWRYSNFHIELTWSWLYCQKKHRLLTPFLPSFNRISLDNCETQAYDSNNSNVYETEEQDESAENTLWCQCRVLSAERQ